MLNGLARFMGYERPVDALPVVGHPEEDHTPLFEVFQTMVGPHIVVLEGCNIQHGQLLPIWHIKHLIFAYYIDPKKHTTECPIVQAKLMFLVARGTLVDLSTYLFMTLQENARSHKLSALPYGFLLT